MNIINTREKKLTITRKTNEDGLNSHSGGKVEYVSVIRSIDEYKSG